MKKNNILLAIQAETSLSYEIIKSLYEITKSYDAIIEINDIALKYNIDIIEVAQFLYKKVL